MILGKLGYSPGLDFLLSEMEVTIPLYRIYVMANQNYVVSRESSIQREIVGEKKQTMLIVVL